MLAVTAGPPGTPAPASLPPQPARVHWRARDPAQAPQPLADCAAFLGQHLPGAFFAMSRPDLLFLLRSTEPEPAQDMPGDAPAGFTGLLRQHAKFFGHHRKAPAMLA